MDQPKRALLRQVDTLTLDLQHRLDPCDPTRETLSFLNLSLSLPLHLDH